MKIIKEGEPQPVACEKCNNFYGYMSCDSVKGFYHSHFEAYGESCGGSYNDTMRTVVQFKTPYCLNCASKLNFKLHRER